MAPTTTLGVLCLVVSLAEVGLGFALGLAAKRRGGGLAVGAVITAVCGVVAWQTGSAPALYVAVVAQVVALTSLALVLRRRADGAEGGAQRRT